MPTHQISEFRSCVKVEVAVLYSVHPSNGEDGSIKRENSAHTSTELRSCVKVEVAVLGSRP